MKYAIIESGGKQYKVIEGETLDVDRLSAEPGSKIKLNQVLLFSEDGAVTVGTPVIKDFTIWTEVVKHFKGEKVTIFNYSPKKRIRVKTGHRQTYTRLLVEQIGGAKLLVMEPTHKLVKSEDEQVLEKKTQAVKKVESKSKAQAAVKAAPKKPAVKKAASKTVTKSAGKKPTSTSRTAKSTKPVKVSEKTVKSAGKTTKSTGKTPAKPAKAGTKKPASSVKKTTGKK